MDATRRSALARFGSDRRLIVASLVALTLVAWAYIWVLAEGMAHGDMSLMGMGEDLQGAAMPMGAEASTPTSGGAAMPMCGDASMPMGGDASMPMGGDASMPMQDMLAASSTPWTPATFGLMFQMWLIMMVGMMVPSSMPTILLYARVQRHWLPEQSAARHV